MQFDGFHHVGLWVKDARKSFDFYTQGLGGKEIKSFPMSNSDKTIYLVDLGNNAVVEIIPRGNGEEEANAHWAHLALRTGDARAAYETALEAGAVSRDEPRDIMLGSMSVCNAFVYGPDREVIEFFQVKN
ncbi:MAG: VOC family protein [Treponema sp.]|jgi:lactoylglutathione lyase|nr:VOC family protein [Treponema sp.]